LAELGFAYLSVIGRNWDGIAPEHYHKAEIVEVEDHGESFGVALGMKFLSSACDESMQSQRHWFLDTRNSLANLTQLD
jgi:hypothetical protein